MKKLVFTGTYTGSGSEGVYNFAFEDGKFGKPSLFTAVKNPKYIDIDGNQLVCCGDFENGSGAALVNEKGEIIDKKVFEQRTSCFITKSGDRVYTANYHEGTFTALKVQDNALSLIQTVHIRDGAGCHQVLVGKDRLLVPSLFLDRVMMYDFNLNPIGSIRFTHGTGPRHGVFSHDGKYLYLTSELSNEVFAIDTDKWEIENSIDVLPNGEKHVRGGAAIRLNEAGDRLYISTRGKDVISVIEVNGKEMKLKQTVLSGGRQPRDFILAGKYLLCADRYSNKVVSFELHEDGTIGSMIDEVQIPEPVSLKTVDL